MKTYQIKNLQKELSKRIAVVETIKTAMSREEIPTWSKNNLIKEHNMHVRVIKTIRGQLLNAL